MAGSQQALGGAPGQAHPWIWVTTGLTNVLWGGFGVCMVAILILR